VFEQRLDGSQGAILRSRLENHVLSAFADRILPIDTAVARRSATLQPDLLKSARVLQVTYRAPGIDCGDVPAPNWHNRVMDWTASNGGDTSTPGGKP
jgi:hypothetical protein